MKVLLISANTETINMPTLPLGLACVAAATREAGHDVALLNLMFERNPRSAIREAIEDVRPGAIGVSVRNIDDQSMAPTQFLLPPVRQVVSICRSLCGAPVIVGGAGYSIFPESALRYLEADAGVQGEGETAFPELVGRIAAGTDLSGIPGVYLPGRPAAGRSFAGSLDDLPLPDPGLWTGPAANREMFIPVQTRRGCPLDCSYCSTSMIEGRSIRRRSPGRVVKWLAELRETGCRNFSFVDNTFNLPPSYAKDLCRGIIDARLDLNCWCIAYPKWIDPELAQLMKRAGFSEISLGFESGSDYVLRGFNKQFDREDVRAVSKMFAEAGIRRRGFLMLGAPGETRDTVEESFAFADSLNLEALKVTLGIRIYPHTPLARTAAAEGIIRTDDDLLRPRFYLAPALADWLPGRVAAYRASRPWVV
ncbi:MAG: cobalamin-dependent protein [Acidobacteria bacterium]|nr:cobalamin-dependent protein [Acidobacteriota bacterium]